ncbi:MAG: 3-hydroxyacyl-[acyl-carrier-protein] dehydratase FabZ [Candidatus Methylomirabilia bacterium]
MRFLLVDRLLEVERGKRLVATKCVALSEDYFADHFPDCPVMPASIIVEGLEQASHLLVGLSSEFTRAATLRRVPRASFRGLVSPGDRLLLRVTLTLFTETEARVQATADSEAQTIADAQLEFDLKDAAEDPQAAECCRRLQAFYSLLTADPVPLFGTPLSPAGGEGTVRGADRHVL